MKWQCVLRTPLVGLILLAISANTSSKAQGATVFDRVLIFPFGWESEKQVSSASSSIQLDPRDGYTIEGRDVVFFAPFPGSFEQKSNALVLEGNSARVVYPLTGTVSITKSNKLEKGDPIVRYKDAAGDTFLFLLENSTLGSQFINFENGEFDFSTNQPFKVFSIWPGVVEIHRRIFEDDESRTLSVNGDQYDVTYMGVRDLLVSDGSRIEAGTEIGTSNKAYQTYWVGVKVYKSSSVQLLNPIIIGLQNLK